MNVKPAEVARFAAASWDSTRQCHVVLPVNLLNTSEWEVTGVALDVTDPYEAVGPYSTRESLASRPGWASGLRSDECGYERRAMWGRLRYRSSQSRPYPTT